MGVLMEAALYAWMRMYSVLNFPEPLDGTKNRHPSRASTIHWPERFDGIFRGRPLGIQLGGSSETFVQKPS
jgi:hypothetical protein